LLTRGHLVSNWAALLGLGTSAELAPDEVVDRIVALQRHIEDFWSDARGWAPDAAADLLEECRLDRQVSLSECLRLWIVRPEGAEPELSDGELILGWANLGSLLESTLKLLLVVFLKDYLADDEPPRDRKGKVRVPTDLTLEAVRQFFVKKSLVTDEWATYIHQVQVRRNAIHSLRERDVGSSGEFIDAVRRYLDLLNHIEGRLPTPFFPPDPW
jgi:hypothetical protein